METINGKNIARKFFYEDKEFIILEPSLNVLREAKYRHSKSYTASIKAGLYTQKTLETLLRDEQPEVINDHLSRRADLLKNLTESQELLNSSTDPDQMLALAELVRVCRDGLLQEEMSMNSLFSATAEQMAEDDRINYLTFCLVKDVFGKEIWNSFDEFLNDNRYGFIDSCKYNVYCWDFKVDPQWRATLPEEIAIKRAEKILEDRKNEEVANIEILEDEGVPKNEENSTKRLKKASKGKPKGRKPKIKK